MSLQIQKSIGTHNLNLYTMSFNKKQLDADSKFAKKKVNKPQYIIPVSKSIATPNVKMMGGSIKKSGRGC